MDTKNKSMTEKDLCLIGKIHSFATCYSSSIWLSFSNNWTQLLVSSEEFKISANCLAECLENFPTCFETNTQLRFLFIGKYLEFLKKWFVTSIGKSSMFSLDVFRRLHTSNENLELLSDVLISTFYFWIFHSA